MFGTDINMTHVIIPVHYQKGRDQAYDLETILIYDPNRLDQNLKVDQRVTTVCNGLLLSHSISTPRAVFSSSKNYCVCTQHRWLEIRRNSL